MDATSSTGADHAMVDPDLDRAMMQTITDVKYVKRRPKFIAVGMFIFFLRNCNEVLKKTKIFYFFVKTNLLSFLVDANFQRQCLEAHNLVREKYGCPTLMWSQELADLVSFKPKIA